MGKSKEAIESKENYRKFQELVFEVIEKEKKEAKDKKSNNK